MHPVDERGILRVAEWEKYPWLVHGFSTRKTGNFLDWPDDAAITKTFGGGGATAMPRQVHSARVVEANSGWGLARPEADAVITPTHGLLVGVRTADCVPILLLDPRRRIVAAVHAGWRGTVTGVLDNAIAHLTKKMGAQSSDLEAAIGPAIGACCFEVGREVAGEFPAEFVVDRQPRPHVDLVATLEARLRSHGVSRTVNVSSCTQCDPTRFHSYRANGDASGRMLSVIGIR